MVAHHEMGHALVAAALPGTDPVHKVSIIPRGVGALGYTIQRPTEDRYLMVKDELEKKMAVLLGGRAAEQVIFNHLSTGAADDLNKVTEIARSMITRYAMVPAAGARDLRQRAGGHAGAGAGACPGGTTATRPRARSTAPSAGSSSRPSTRARAILDRNRDLLEEARPAAAGEGDPVRDGAGPAVRPGGQGQRRAPHGLPLSHPRRA